MIKNGFFIDRKGIAHKLFEKGDLATSYSGKVYEIRGLEVIDSSTSVYWVNSVNENNIVRWINVSEAHRDWKLVTGSKN